jgi:uncharacterized protein YecA (UPF0149 family)
MKATELLQQQHEEIKALYARYEQADDDDEKQALFEEIADSLAAHTTIEERIFYPATYGDELEEELKEAVEEHLAVKRELADLLGMTPDEEQFDAKMKVLIEMVDHHVEEEEREILPRAEAQLGDARLVQLGEEMERLFDELMSEGPSDEIPLQTEQAASLK